MIKEKNIFIVGIKGVAMTNLAIILKKMGKIVTGSDVSEIFITDEILKKNKIKTITGFEPKNLPLDTELVIYSAAHQGLKNPQIIEAIRRKIKILSQTQVLSMLLKEFKQSIAVCGCHGKTTTTAFLAYSLIKLGKKPSYLVGSPSFNNYLGGDFQEKNYFIIEADEYGVDPPRDKRPKFIFLKPDWVIATNIDFDHPDVYQDIEETRKAFFNFFQKKKLILNIDDESLKEYYLKNKKRTSENMRVIGYGFSSGGDYQISQWRPDRNGSYFLIKDLINNEQEEFYINLFGRHNVLNASGVVIQLFTLGFNFTEIKEAIKGFKGARRRFELILKKDNFVLLDDYAHHPNEIKATIEAARLRFPGKKIVVVFQPHTFSRTKRLLTYFINSLSLSDISIVLDIFSSAREKKENYNIDAEKIVIEAEKKGLKNILYKKKSEIKDYLLALSKKNTVIITMGAGDVYNLKNIWFS